MGKLWNGKRSTVVVVERKEGVVRAFMCVSEWKLRHTEKVNNAKRKLFHSLFRYVHTTPPARTRRPKRNTPTSGVGGGWLGRCLQNCAETSFNFSFSAFFLLFITISLHKKKHTARVENGMEKMILQLVVVGLRRCWWCCWGDFCVQQLSLFFWNGETTISPRRNEKAAPSRALKVDSLWAHPTINSVVHIFRH